MFIFLIPFHLEVFREFLSSLMENVYKHTPRDERTILDEMIFTFYLTLSLSEPLVLHIRKGEKFF